MQNNKTLHLVIITGALLSLLLVSTTCSNFVYAQNKFRAKLDADNLVPPADSPAKGVVNFKIKDNAIQSKINITGITDVTGAQIIMRKIGQSGDPIVDLLKTGEKTERSDGVAIKGNFTASDFGGSMQGKALSDLESAMMANQTYVSIMTNAHPDGEIGGIIYFKSTSTATQDITGTEDITGTSNSIEENDEDFAIPSGIEENDGDFEEDAEGSEDDEDEGDED